MSDDYNSMTKSDLIERIKENHNMLMLRKHVADVNNINHSCYDYLQSYMRDLERHTADLLVRILRAINSENDILDKDIKIAMAEMGVA